MSRQSIGSLVLFFTPILFAAFSLPARAHSREEISALLVRAQLTKWPMPTRKPPERIERNEAGKVVSLRLDGMRLEPRDIERICSFKELERLSLNHTTITDAELAMLAELPRLQSLTLNFTAIGDEGVASLASLPKLKTVCMFRVQASPEAVRALRKERRHLSLGYVPLGK